MQVGKDTCSDTRAVNNTLTVDDTNGPPCACVYNQNARMRHGMDVHELTYKGLIDEILVMYAHVICSHFNCYLCLRINCKLLGTF